MAFCHVLANANFAELGHDDRRGVTTALPSKRVDLATEDATTACNTRLFISTASGDAKLYGLQASTWIAKANRLANRWRWAANGSWLAANRGRSFAAHE